MSAPFQLSPALQRAFPKNAPREITQESLDHRGDPGHLKRLCANSAQKTLPQADDFWAYAHDLRFMPIQQELMAYLLPMCLAIWRSYLIENHADYAGIEYFCPALKIKILESPSPLLDEKQRHAIEEYVQDFILERIAMEKEIHFAGSGASPYQWASAVGTYAVTFPSLEQLWDRWWNSDAVGHLTAKLQYLACLMYEAPENPVFYPWTPDKGGCGELIVLWDPAGHFYDEHSQALTENWRFLEETLTVPYLQKHLHHAVDALDHPPVGEIMLRQFSEQQPLIQLRLEMLPKLLSGPGPLLSWSI